MNDLIYSIPPEDITIGRLMGFETFPEVIEITFGFDGQEDTVANVLRSDIEDGIYRLWKFGPFSPRTFKPEVYIVLSHYDFMTLDSSSVQISARGMDWVLGLEPRELFSEGAKV